MDVDFDSERSVIFIEVGRRSINGEIVRNDLEKFRKLLDQSTDQVTLIVDILTLPSGNPLEIPSILNSVVNFSSTNKTLVESKIFQAYLISRNSWGKSFIDLLLQRRKSNVPVVICSSIEEAVSKFQNEQQ